MEIVLRVSKSFKTSIGSQNDLLCAEGVVRGVGGGIPTQKSTGVLVVPFRDGPLEK